MLAYSYMVVHLLLPFGILFGDNSTIYKSISVWMALGSLEYLAIMVSTAGNLCMSFGARVCAFLWGAFLEGRFLYVQLQ